MNDMIGKAPTHVPRRRPRVRMDPTLRILTAATFVLLGVGVTLVAAALVPMPWAL